MRSAKTPQFMPTEGAKMAAIDASECLADHDRQIESLRHGLDPADAAGPITVKSSRAAAPILP